MALHTYRYRRDAPITTAQLVRLVAPSATVVAGAGGPVYDIQVDDSRLADLDEILARDGYTRTVTDPVGTPVTQIRIADGTFLSVGAVSDGQSIQRSGTSLIGGSGSSFDIRDVVFFDHMLASNNTTDRMGPPGWRVDATGTANAQTVSGESGHPGIFLLDTGTGGTARSAVQMGDAGFENIIIGGNSITYECLVSFRTSVAAANLLRWQIGVGSGWGLANPNNLTDGIYFRLQPGASANILGVCRAAGSETTRDMGVAPTLTNWYRLGWTWAPGPTVQFRINGVNTGATVATTIPSALLGIGFRGDSGGGAANPRLAIDYVSLQQVTAKET
jgi:hypothetical protein